MIREIKFVNLFTIGNKVIIKYRSEEGLGSYVDNGKFSIKILYNGNIISPQKMKKIDNKVVRADYYFNESKKLIMDLINYGMKLIVTYNGENKEFEIKNIDESKVYTNLYTRFTESKKFSDIIDFGNKIFLDKEEYIFNSKLKKDKNFKREVMYTKFYEEESLDDKVILYESFHGNTMGCNPYAIFKYLLNNDEYNGFEHIWVLNDINNCKDLYKNLDNVKFIKLNSEEYLRYLAKAKYLINNATFPPYYIRKEGQVYLNTWHGTPIKTLGKLVKGSKGQHKNVQRNLLQSTHLINQNKFTADIIIKENDIDGIYQGKVFNCGYPRIDLTLNSNKCEIKKMLNIDNKKVILYAPTWRGKSGYVDSEINKFIDDYEYLLEKVGDEYTILLRVHHFMMRSLIEKGYGDYIVDNTVDTNELLSIVDVLITDYSSIIFDFIPTKNPILLYCYDKDVYSKTRGFILDLDELPGYICNTINDVALNLKNIDKVINITKEKYSLVQKKYNYNDDGKATKRVIDFIFNDNGNYYNVSSNKKNILIYCGSFLNNGITASAINLLNNIDYTKYDVSIISTSELNKVSEYNISNVNYNAKIIYRCGKMLSLKNEYVKYKHISSNGLLENINEDKEILSLYQREFKRLFGNSKFDVVIDFGGYSEFWALLFATSKINKRIIYQHSDMMKEYNMNRFPHGKVIFPLYNNFTNIISVSKHVMNNNKKNLLNWNIEVEKKLNYIPNTINYKNIIQLSNHKSSIKLNNKDYCIGNYEYKNGNKIILEAFPSVDETRINFICIGRISPEKDHEKLIRAFKRVNEVNRNTKLYIVGEGVLSKTLEKQIIELDMQEDIILTGQLKNPFSLAKQCDCFVLSSNHEGQPMVLLEMLILNKDIIATDIPGNRSVLEDGYGMLCDNTEEGLVEAMINYISNKDKYSFKKFDYEKYNKEAIDMFYKVIGHS